MAAELELFVRPSNPSAKVVAGELWRTENRTFVRLGDHAFPLTDASAIGRPDKGEVKITDQRHQKRTCVNLANAVPFDPSWPQFCFKSNPNGETPNLCSPEDSTAIREAWRLFLASGCLRKNRTKSDYNCGECILVDMKVATVISSGVYNVESKSVVVRFDDGSVATVGKGRLRRVRGQEKTVQMQQIIRELIHRVSSTNSTFFHKFQNFAGARQNTSV